jgi:predicted ATP-grasp superfamily ATP-dependent carboligase
LFGYLAFWDAEGVERAWLTKQKLRQHPPNFGDGSLQITADVPEVAELSRRLLRAFCYRGLVGVEFKHDARDGSYRLMEINPRTVSGNQLAITAGIDFPAIAYEYLSGCRLGIDQAQTFRPGVKFVNEEWDLKAYLALRKTGRMSVGHWLRSLRGTQARAIGAWDDPFPVVVVLWRFLSAFCRKVLSTMNDMVRRRV